LGCVAGGAELAVLAAGTVALWKAETALYSPLLVEHLPGAPLLAGMTLHHLYGQRLYPWLKAGTSELTDGRC